MACRRRKVKVCQAPEEGDARLQAEAQRSAAGLLSRASLRAPRNPRPGAQPPHARAASRALKDSATVSRASRAFAAGPRYARYAPVARKSAYQRVR